MALLVARVIWDHEAAGSNPVTRTTKTHYSKPSFLVSNRRIGDDFHFLSSANNWIGDVNRYLRV